LRLRSHSHKRRIGCRPGRQRGSMHRRAGAVQWPVLAEVPFDSAANQASRRRGWPVGALGCDKAAPGARLCAQRVETHRVTEGSLRAGGRSLRTSVGSGGLQVPVVVVLGQARQRGAEPAVLDVLPQLRGQLGEVVQRTRPVSRWIGGNGSAPKDARAGPALAQKGSSRVNSRNFAQPRPRGGRGPAIHRTLAGCRTGPCPGEGCTWTLM